MEPKISTLNSLPLHRLAVVIQSATVHSRRSTPIPNGGNLAPNRQFGSIQRYNAIAKRVMDEKAITINDLNAAVTSKIDKLQKSNDVHFTDEGSEKLAEHVAKAIRLALQRKTP